MKRKESGNGKAKGVSLAQIQDPQVPEVPMRRKFTAQYKLDVLKELNSVREPGEIGAIIRREGLYSSSIALWRKQMERGELESLTPKKRGPKAPPANPTDPRLKELERENRCLKKKLEYANLLLDIQKKFPR